MDYPPPSSLLRPLSRENLTLYGPGPTNSAPRVCHASSMQMYAIFCPPMNALMTEVQEGIRYLFQTRNELTYVLSASGTAGMEAALANLLERGDKCMCLVSGYWGDMAADVAERCGAVVTPLVHAPGEPFTLAEVEKALSENRPHVLYVAQGESSSGLLQPIEGLGPLCHRFDCLLVVDTVASIGATPFFMDRWEVDVVYTASQKAVSCPPGLAPISFSDRARKKIAARTTKVQSYLLDVNKSMAHWAIDGQPRKYHHTLSCTLLFALREGLSMVVNEGLEHMWKRHFETTKQLCSGIEELGLELYIKNPEYRVPTVTSIRIPEGIESPGRLVSYSMEKHQVEFGNPLPPLQGKIWRIGLMGYNANELNAKKALAVFQEALIHIGYTPKMKAEL